MRSRLSFLGVLVGLGTCAAVATWVTLGTAPTVHGQSGVPRYEIDVSWPQPLPDRWVVGGLVGVCLDSRDHVFILNRQNILEVELNGGSLAPIVMELDPSGRVVNSWGDPKLLDPRIHSCHVDPDDNVWIGSAPSGMIQKYSHDGSKMLLQIGKKGVVDSSDGTDKGKPLNSPGALFYTPSAIFVDRQNGDVFVADGEFPGGNHRVAVMDRTGKFLRHWLPEGMEVVHCLTIAKDGLVYVCDRFGDRIQVYDKMGNLKRTIAVPWKPYTPVPAGAKRENAGGALAIGFSHDPGQRFLFLINQNTSMIDIFDRQTGKLLSSFGGGAGSYPGQFDQPHDIAVDSRGNLYVAENRGKRVQKFKIAGTVGP